jgi:hypothetical protein
MTMDEDLKTQTALTTALADAMERAPGGGWAAWLILDAILGQDFANARLMHTHRHRHATYSSVFRSKHRA